MNIGVRNTLFGIAAMIALVLGLLTYSLQQTTAPGDLQQTAAGALSRTAAGASSGMTEEEASTLGYYRFDKPRPLSEFSLLDQAGQPVGLDALRGQWSVLFFGFTSCPHICPTTLRVLNDVALEHPPQIILVSVDPERDDPERLRRYLAAFNPTFRGFTGSFEETVNLASQVNIAFGKVPGDASGTYTVDHNASLVIIDPAASYTGFIKAPHQAGKIERVMRSL